jgi:monovalent cation:H+ antiporter-2, CPA2 family
MFTNPVIIIAVLLAAAVVGGMIAHRLRQPVILGYLVIGAAVGPHALGLIGDQPIVEAAATIGVALLMFALGLETSFSQLKQTGKVGSVGGLLQVALTFAGGFLAGIVLFRWPAPQSAIFGLVISLSSTAVCLKILVDRGELDSVHGRIMIAILVLQDISVVVMTILVPLIGGPAEAVWIALAIATGKALLFGGIAVSSGLWILPWIMGRVGGVRTRELFLLVILALCLGAALGTQIFGLSSVFGAFLIGMVLHDSKFAHHALTEITPLRDIFATLFFVSLGMLFDPGFTIRNWPLVLLTVGIIVAIKFIAVFGIVRFFGYSNKVATVTGAGLFQVSEFGFLLAGAGIASRLVTEDFYSLVLASAIITMLLTPFSVNLASRFGPKLLHHPATSRQPLETPEPSHDAVAPVSSNPVVLAGYGRIGQNMAQGLQDSGIPFIVVDLDPDRVDAARKLGRPCYHGDASNPAVLEALDIGHAAALAVTFPDPVAVVNAVKTAVEMNPKLKVVARVHREREARALDGLENVELVSPEYEASLEFVERLLTMSGWKRSRIQETMPVVASDDDFVAFAREGDE